MKQSWFTEEQITYAFKQVDSGEPVWGGVSGTLGIRQQRSTCWCRKYQGKDHRGLPSILGEEVYSEEKRKVDGRFPALLRNARSRRASPMSIRWCKRWLIRRMRSCWEWLCGLMAEVLLEP